MTHICVSKLTIIGSENGLSPGRCQAIIWTNTGILLIGPLGTNFIEILIEIYTFSFKKMNLKMSHSSGKWRAFCLGHNVLRKETKFVWLTGASWRLWRLYLSAWVGQWTGSVMVWRMFGTKPSPGPMLIYCHLDPWKKWIGIKKINLLKNIQHLIMFQSVEPCQWKWNHSSKAYRRWIWPWPDVIAMPLS